ncbi:MAG: type III-B CRISPR module RAMP protein Cmr4 [Lentisphaerae bacterium]|nr:MAG: type III-B CRISPR module RAMP protein Cmr4 [Lentisphaerota bacterium]
MTESQYLLSIYTCSPLHIGRGNSVDIVDLPVMRERVTHFPVIPASSIKGILRQHAGASFAGNDEAHTIINMLFGYQDERQAPISERNQADEYGESDVFRTPEKESYSGCVTIGEGRILAFPVRSMVGGFVWLTCPTALRRFKRDWAVDIDIPDPEIDTCVAGKDVIPDPNLKLAVFEEYPLDVVSHDISPLVKQLEPLCDNPLWQRMLTSRLVVVADETFQHFVSTATEIVARIEMDPSTRMNKQLFHEENIPCETLFYSVCTVIPSRRRYPDFQPGQFFSKLFPDNKILLQFGGNQTVGLGLCEIKMHSKGGN